VSNTITPYGGGCGANDASTKVNHRHLMMVLGTMTAFGPFATDMYLASFPQIAESLGTSLSLVQLTLSMYLIGLAGGQIVYGPVIDHFGRRVPMLAGVALFVVCSLVCAVSTDVRVLIAARLLQAVGGGAGMIIGRAIVRDLFELQDAARFMSALMMVQSIGPIIAPTVGGVLLLAGDWRLLFAVMAAFGAASWWLVYRFLPETLPAERHKPLSFTEFFSAFGYLFTHREFIVMALTGSVSMASMFVFITGSPFVFMKIYGASEQTFGLLFGCTTLSMFFAAQVSRRLLKRMTPNRLFTLTMRVHLLAACGLMLATATHSLPVTMIPLWLCVACVPILMANSSAIAMQASGPYVGSASAVLGVSQFVLASVASTAISVLHDGTAWPIAKVMLGVSVIGNVVYMFRVRTA
jgi:MFS transporter, DHA1 family, multidrug resistance protein